VHFVGRVDWSFAEAPSTESPTSFGLARRVLVGPGQGAVHTELAVGALAPGGWLARHVHSFEEGLYLLEGSLVLEIDTHVHRLVPGDYALIPIAMRHTLVAPRDTGARWLSVNTPPRRPPGANVPDTVFASAGPDVDALVAAAVPVTGGDPTVRYVGHYEGTPPQQEALRLDEPARGRRPAGADTALIAYSGISVKMLIDRVLGADHLTMFTVDYEVGGAAQAHDHPFEEAYFFLAGEVEAELDGTAYTLRPGVVVFAGVASVHGFWNSGAERVRWIETQAPQPPARGSYRWEPTWQRMAARGVERWPSG
jgi:quercetin dioxygenase-like cupin family protein